MSVDGEHAHRYEREAAHGRHLGKLDTITVWGWGTPAGHARAERRAALITDGAGLKPEMQVMEIGCGTGMFTQIFADQGCYITAVDLSPELLAAAKTRSFPKENVNFIQKPFEECQDAGKFDAIIGSSVLHHLDLEKALGNIHHMLGSGGRIAFAEPNMLNPQIFLERKFRRFFHYVSPDEVAFLRWKFAADLRNAGFTDVQITPFDWLHPATPRPLVPLVSALGRFLEFTPGGREFSGSLLITASRP